MAYLLRANNLNCYMLTGLLLLLVYSGIHYMRTSCVYYKYVQFYLLIKKVKIKKKKLSMLRFWPGIYVLEESF